MITPGLFCVVSRFSARFQREPFPAFLPGCGSRHGDAVGREVALCPFHSYARGSDPICEPHEGAAVELLGTREGYLDIPDWELRDNLASASWAVTCTKAGHERLATLAPETT